MRRAGEEAFEQAMVFTDVRENKACGEQDSVCRVPWLDWKIEIFPDGLPGEGGVEDAGADAGDDAGSSMGSHGDDGCGCHVPGRSKAPQRGLLGLWFLLAAWSLVRRRRR